MDLYQAAKKIVMCQSTDEIYENLKHLRNAVEAENTRNERTLTLQELSLDNLPLDGTHVVFFDNHTSFGMFEQHFTKQGKVQYLYGDIAETLDEAIEAGGFIHLGEELLDDEEMAIPVTVCEHTLYEGCLWLYEHNYYPVLEPNAFPFQTEEYFKIALEQGWCELESEQPKVGRFQAGENVKAFEFTYQTVKFNGKTLRVSWIVCGERKSFHGFDVVD